MSTPRRPALGILMLEGKMSVEPGCMACEATFPYPVVRKTVAGSRTPRSAEEAEAMLPLYAAAASELAAEGVGAITANCGLIALLQRELAQAVDVPVVTSALLLVPTLHRMMPGRKIGVLTFFTDAVGERNYRASGWSSDEIPVVLAGVGDSAAWNEFLRTKEIPPALRRRMEADLVASVRALLDEHPDVGALVSECTLLPTCLDTVRASFDLPVFDVLAALDFAMSGSWRPAAPVAAVGEPAP